MFIKEVWHFFKCVLILNMEIGPLLKRKFFSFGKNSNIYKPYLQMCGIDKVSIGLNTTILQGARISVYGQSNKKEAIIIGDRCYIGYGFSILAASTGKIVIGNDVLFASNIIVTNENHGMNPELNVPYMNQELACKDIIIGDGCWLGERVCVLPGVEIGEKSIIGANSVVTRSIPAYSIAVGNPARVIKEYDFEKHVWVNKNEKK